MNKEKHLATYHKRQDDTKNYEITFMQSYLVSGAGLEPATFGL